MKINLTVIFLFIDVPSPLKTLGKTPTSYLYLVMNLDAITSFPRHLFITGGKELDIRFVQIIDATFHQAALMFSTCRSRHFRSIPSASSSASRAGPWESAGRRSAGSWPRTRSADARRAQRRGRTSSAAERPWLEKKEETYHHS